MAVLRPVAEHDFKMTALFDVLQATLINRNVPVKNLELGPVTPAANDTVRREIKLSQGIPQEKAKAIVKAIKDSKLKVQGSIQGDSVRVSGKSRDDLQQIIALARGKQDELKIDLMFENFRD